MTLDAAGTTIWFVVGISVVFVIITIYRMNKVEVI
jgi:hypothetical protein